jgi:uncharacterized protein YoxC
MTETQDNKSEEKIETTSAETPFEGDAMDRFVRTFEATARRWELVVYPAMLAFVILAAYGFFLIYTLSKDIHTLALGMDPEMARNLGNMADSVVYLSENIRTMTRRVDTMTGHIEDISEKMDALDTLEPMLVNMRGMNVSMGSMDQSVRVITASTDAMRYEVGRMGNSMRPMGVMSDFMPW